MMEKNESSLDRIVRIVLGIVFALVAYSSGTGWVYILSVLMIVTGVTGFCAIYKILGISTNGKKK